jgi:hypothetical protein
MAPASRSIPITGMPDALAAAVNSYDEATRYVIVTNWVLLGSEDRQRYRDKIQRSRQWTRRWRAEVAAAQLSR